MGDESRVLNGDSRVKVGSDWNAFTVDNDHSHHTLVTADALQGLFYFTLKIYDEGNRKRTSEVAPFFLRETESRTNVTSRAVNNFT